MLQYIRINILYHYRKNRFVKKSFYILEVFKIGTGTHICARGTVLMYESLILEIHLGTDSYCFKDFFDN